MSTFAARPSDVATLDAILHAMYEVISGPVGQTRDWDRFRSLFVPGARLMPVISPPGEPARVRVLNPEDYIRRVEPIFAHEDFWERESSREVTIFGRVAHVLSHYESLHDLQGKPFDRGTNSMQLFCDGSRWWIVSAMWNTARSE
ncbi:MAG TPA: hypothetical protein VLE48_00125 [Terriglobales bacterium]|nr:hypothetical protein [Terriglobales bacterium]